MPRKSKSVRKTPARSTKVKPSSAKVSKTKKAATKPVRAAASTRKSARRAQSHEFDQAIDRCVATFDEWRKECVAQVQRLVRAGRSYFRSKPRKRSTGRMSTRKAT